MLNATVTPFHNKTIMSIIIVWLSVCYEVNIMRHGSDYEGTL